MVKRIASLRQLAGVGWLLSLLLLFCLPNHAANGQSVDDLRSLFNLDMIERGGVRIDFKCSIRMTFSESPERNATIQQRNVIEFFPNGAVREIAYEILPDGTPYCEPIRESLFDSRQFLSVTRDENNEARLIYYLDPAMADSIGTRGHGLLPFLALTPFQTSSEWNLCTIVEDSGFTIQTRPEGGLEIVSDSAVGRVKIHSDAKRRMEYLKIVADRPSDSFYGLQLEQFGDQLIWQTFEDFRYVEPDQNNTTGLAEFKTTQFRRLASGELLQQGSQVMINQIKPISHNLPRLSVEANFLTALPDEMEITTIGNPHLNFVYRHGRVEKVTNAKMERQLTDVAEILNEGEIDSIKPDWAPPPSSGLCGLHSLFAISQRLETQTVLADLMEDEFCSSSSGSTAADLQLAGESIGLKSHIVAGLNVDDLSAISSPAILHVRPRGRADSFSHWIAFFGKNREGTFDVLDSSFGFEKMSPSELASRFDGSALIFDKNQKVIAESLARLTNRRLIGAAFVGAALLFLALGISLLSRKTGRHGWIAAGTLVAFSAISFGYHTLRPDGLLGAELDVARRLAVNSTIEFPRVSLSDIHQIENGNDSAIALIDTRYSRDFLHGTIGNAINYPLDILPDIEQRLIVELKKREKVVVFCQSKTCPFSEQIGRRLVTMGVQNVFLFDGGFKEWSNHGPSR